MLTVKLKQTQTVLFYFVAFIFDKSDEEEYGVPKEYPVKAPPVERPLAEPNIAGRRHS